MAKRVAKVESQLAGMDEATEEERAEERRLKQRSEDARGEEARLKGACVIICMYVLTYVCVCWADGRACIYTPLFGTCSVMKHQHTRNQKQRPLLDTDTISYMYKP